MDVSLYSDDDDDSLIESEDKVESEVALHCCDNDDSRFRSYDFVEMEDALHSGDDDDPRIGSEDLVETKDELYSSDGEDPRIGSGDVLEEMIHEMYSGDDDDSIIGPQGYSDAEVDEDEFFTKLTTEEIMAMTFDRLEDAQIFYSRYSKANGFSIRKRDGKREGTGWSMRRWVCSKAGKRMKKTCTLQIKKRKPRPLTRCGCHAAFRVLLDKAHNQWKVSKFNQIHNHKLVSRSHVHLLRHHRNVSAADMAQIKAMLSVGVRPCHIYKLMLLQNGGASNAPFQNKDMYNEISKSKSLDIQHGDVVTTFAYFDARKERDLGFEYEYTEIEGGVLGNLFWCDSRSKLDYDYFGDVVMFDSTFGTNIYGRSLVLFIGIDNHHHTCIFGCGLLNGETLENYEWLLRRLLAAMDGKPPRSVMTDSDNAMRAAITRVFPDCPHRLCSWHLMRNAQKKIPSDDFGGDFYKCMVAETEVAFEALWKGLLETYECENNRWILKMYKKRKMWSCAHLKDAFFAGQHANSRSESMNFVTKCYINKKNNFYELVRHYETALQHVRDKETTSNYNSKHTTAVSNQLLKSIDDSAAEVYTLESLEVFRQELVMESMTKLRPETFTCGMTTRYICGVVYHPEISLVVNFNARDNSASCDCKRFESTGFICRHIIHVLKYRDIKTIPLTCILPRWTKDVKKLIDDRDGSTYTDDVVRVIRQGMLNMACDELCNYASRSLSVFSRVRNEIASLTLWAKDKIDEPSVSAAAQNPTHNAELPRDPPRTRTRQPEQQLGPKPKKRPRKCSVCRSEKHRKPKCPRYLRSLGLNVPNMGGRGSDIDSGIVSEDPSTEILTYGQTTTLRTAMHSGIFATSASQTTARNTPTTLHASRSWAMG